MQPTILIQKKSQVQIKEKISNKSNAQDRTVEYLPSYFSPFFLSKLLFPTSNNNIKTKNTATEKQKSQNRCEI